MEVNTLTEFTLSNFFTQDQLKSINYVGVYSYEEAESIRAAVSVVLKTLNSEEDPTVRVGCIGFLIKLADLLKKRNYGLAQEQCGKLWSDLEV